MVFVFVYSTLHVRECEYYNKIVNALNKRLFYVESTRLEWARSRIRCAI